MIESIISSAHHYYLMVFRPENQSALGLLLKRISDDNNIAELIFPDKKSIFHCQKKLNKTYGSKELLNMNIDSKDNLIWYDFYVGESVINNELIFYLCFPYKGIQKILIRDIIPEFLSNAIFFKPSLKKIMHYMKERNKIDNNDELQNKFDKKLETNLNFKADIIKYVASVVETNADKIQISGKNPLNSIVFEILQNQTDSKKISIETSSMKLNCRLFDKKITKEAELLVGIGGIDIIFDHYGNYRFWIPPSDYYNISTTLSMIHIVLKYFEEIDGFEDQNIEELSEKEDLNE